MQHCYRRRSNLEDDISTSRNSPTRSSPMGVGAGRSSPTPVRGMSALAGHSLGSLAATRSSGHHSGPPSPAEMSGHELTRSVHI